MAETAKKPSTRKRTPTKRGPTKTAALKALGLTQSDLDALKAVAKAVNAKTYDEEVEALETIVGHPLFHDESPEEVVNQPDRNEELQETEAPQAGPFYARNLRYADVRFKLTRQEEKGRKSTLLKPRGQRGDLIKLEAEDLDDPNLQSQITYGLIEIVTAAEAREIISKQGINEQERVHPAMALLRNELGKPYAEGAVKLEEEFNSQGIVVARTESVEGSEYGAIPSQGRGIDWAAARNLNEQAPQQQELGDGQVRPPRGRESEFVRDQIARDARKRGIQGPEAGLGGLNVVVGPTERG